MSVLSHLNAAISSRPTFASVVAEFQNLGATPSGRELDQLAARLSVTWVLRQPQMPLEAFSRDVWLDLWDAVGYVYSGVRAPHMRPSAPLTLFRAAEGPEFAASGLSWTPRRALAETWRRHRFGPRGAVYEVTVEPSALRALLLHDFTMLPEYVVDVPATAGVTVSEVTS